jgi:hypothetical protein
MTRSHEGAWKKAQTQTRSQHVIRRAGAKTVATGARRGRTEDRKSKAQKARCQRQAHSEELARLRRRGEIHVTDLEWEMD